ncbi:MAG: S8 family serine peptidase [Thermoplasmata archaeon]|nr:MAG: S8 family serine peptidase [Thermoplasmata archaeon]
MDIGMLGGSMEKKNIVLIIVIILAVITVILLFALSLSSNDENGIIPWPDGNGETVERSEWAFETTEITDLNDLGYDGDGVVVGIVDTGIDTSHPDLDHINITAWMDYVNGQSAPYDDEGHGTMMAGIIAASGEIDGAAPKVDMVVVKAISSSGSGSSSDVAAGIDFCVANGADVICLSLGGRARRFNLGDDTAQACDRAIEQGVFVVAAAGNDGEDSNDNDVDSPATVEDVIAVGAIDKNKHIASFSSIGDNDGRTPFPIDDRQDPDKKPELTAPGVDIVSTYPNSKYAEGSGTSQSTAFVAGCIALLLDANPDWQREGSSGGDGDAIDEFKDVFMDTAEKLPEQDTPHDDYYGYGLIQAMDAEARL